jgi:hypothetical protein
VTFLDKGRYPFYWGLVYFGITFNQKNETTNQKRKQATEPLKLEFWNAAPLYQSPQLDVNPNVSHWPLVCLYRVKWVSFLQNVHAVWCVIVCDQMYNNPLHLTWLGRQRLD